MKPGAFEYFRPETLAEAIELLERYDSDAKILAGGQSLVPLLNFRLARPRCLIDINAIQELSYIREVDGHVAIGAMTRQSAIEDSALVARKCPLLVEGTKLMGHRTIRNLGTIGGSLVHADPCAEYPAIIVALDGQLIVHRNEGQRAIPAQDLFLTTCQTTLTSAELLTEIRLPILAQGVGWAFSELSHRHGDYAIVAVAAVVSVDETGTCDDVRIALAGVAPTPERCNEPATPLKGYSPSEQRIKQVAANCAAAVTPEDDIHASATYKKAMVAVYVERALRTALQRTGRVPDAT